MLGLWMAGGVVIPILWMVAQSSLRLHASPSQYRTIIDVCSAEDAVALVRHVCRGDASIDVLVVRLEHVFHTFPISEKMMQILSLLQQRYEGTGGEEEFAILTLLAVAMTTITCPPPRLQERTEQEVTTDSRRPCPSTPVRAGRRGREVHCRVLPGHRTPTLPFRRQASPEGTPSPPRVPSVLMEIGKHIRLPLRTRTRRRHARASRSAPP